VNAGKKKREKEYRVEDFLVTIPPSKKKTLEPQSSSHIVNGFI
jgi:hypothetical protein